MVMSVVSKHSSFPQVFHTLWKTDTLRPRFLAWLRALNRAISVSSSRNCSVLARRKLSLAHKIRSCTKYYYKFIICLCYQ